RGHRRPSPRDVGIWREPGFVFSSSALCRGDPDRLYESSQSSQQRRLLSWKILLGLLARVLSVFWRFRTRRPGRGSRRLINRSGCNLLVVRSVLVVVRDLRKGSRFNKR